MVQESSEILADLYTCTCMYLLIINILTDVHIVMKKYFIQFTVFSKLFERSKFPYTII